MKKKISKKTKAVLSIALVLAVVVTGAFAYLFMGDSKTNVFTVGKVNIKLYEEFDTNLNGTIEADETYSTSRQDISIAAEDVIVPGQIVTKRPYVENVGTAKTWVYVTVGIPTSTEDEILMENGVVQISGKDIDIPVKAYAIQEKYADKDNYKDVWNSYFKKAMQEAVFGQEETSDDNLKERIPLFKILNEDNKNLSTDDIVNTPNSDWESIGFTDGATEQTVYRSIDGYDYYVFAYKNLLSADKTDNANVSSKAFEGVKLIDKIGEIKPVTLEYYLNNDDYDLVATEYYLPGEIVTSLYWDDSLAKNGFSFDWYDEEDVIDKENQVPVSAGFRITEDMAIVGDWTELAEGVLTSDYLTYTLYYDNTADNVYATITGADFGHKNYTDKHTSNEAIDIVIPSVITVTRTNGGTKAFNIDEGTFVAADSKVLSQFADGETKKVYVKKMEGNTDRTETNALRKIAKRVFIGDNITYIGTLFANSDILESVSISNTVKEYGINQATNEGAFQNCVNLKEINFPSLCTYIGQSICNGCTGLKTLNIAGGVQTIEAYAFAYCTGLTKVEISDRVREIKNSAFAGCTSLQTLDLGKGITTLGGGVTAGCSGFDIDYAGTTTQWCSINNLNIMNGHKDLYINNEKVEGELIIPRTVREIPECAFYSDQSITKVFIPGTVKNVGTKAFWNCKNVKELTLSEGVETIRQEAFANIGIDDTLTIPKSVTSLGKWSFCGLGTLNTLEMLSNCKFHDEAFEEDQNREGKTYGTLTVQKYSIGSAVEEYKKPCSKVTNEYYVYGNNPNYASDSKMLYTKDMTTLVKAPINIGENVTIKDGIKTIEASAFALCSVKEVTLSDSVTTINAFAFDNCTKLTNVTIGKGVETIKDSAFARTDAMQEYKVNASNNSYCAEKGVLYDKKATKIIAFPAAKTEYTMPDTVTELAESAFQHSALVSVTLNENITTIPKWAFQGCSSLQSIDIPASVTLIGKQAFQHNKALKEITGGENVEAIEVGAFNGCDSLLEFPADFTSVTVIAESAFQDCDQITIINIPESVTQIGKKAFQGCSSLKTLVLPSKLTEIGDTCFKWCGALTDITVKGKIIGSNMFLSCKALETVVIPGNVENVGYGAFGGCTKLKNVTIEDGVKYLGAGCFQSCYALEEITAPSSVTGSGSGVFEYCSGLKKATINGQLLWGSPSMFGRCDNLQEVVFGGTLGIVGNWLQNHPNVTKVTIENGVQKIWSNAFNGCSGLTEIIIPESVIYVGEYAFKKCTGLTAITLPQNVNKINNNTFADCDNLTEINILSSNVSTIQDNAFANLAHELTINFNGTTEKWYQLQGNRTYNQLGFSSGSNGLAPVKIVCTNGTVTY